MFVLLEQVIGAHSIAVVQQTVLFEVDGGALEEDAHQLVWVPRH